MGKFALNLLNFFPFLIFTRKKMSEITADINSLYAKKGRGSIPARVNFIIGPADPQITTTASRYK